MPNKTKSNKKYFSDIIFQIHEKYLTRAEIKKTDETISHSCAVQFEGQ